MTWDCDRAHIGASDTPSSSCDVYDILNPQLYLPQEHTATHYGFVSSQSPHTPIEFSLRQGAAAGGSGAYFHVIPACPAYLAPNIVLGIDRARSQVHV